MWLESGWVDDIAESMMNHVIALTLFKKLLILPFL